MTVITYITSRNVRGRIPDLIYWEVYFYFHSLLPIVKLLLMVKFELHCHVRILLLWIQGCYYSVVDIDSPPLLYNIFEGSYYFFGILYQYSHFSWQFWDSQYALLYWHKCSSVNLATFLRTPILKNISEQQFLELTTDVFLLVLHYDIVSTNFFDYRISVIKSINILIYILFFQLFLNIIQYS